MRIRVFTALLFRLSVAALMLGFAAQPAVVRAAEEIKYEWYWGRYPTGGPYKYTTRAAAEAAMKTYSWNRISPYPVDRQLLVPVGSPRQHGSNDYKYGVKSVKAIFRQDLHYFAGNYSGCGTGSGDDHISDMCTEQELLDGIAAYMDQCSGGAGFEHCEVTNWEPWGSWNASYTSCDTPQPHDATSCWSNWFVRARYYSIRFVDYYGRERTERTHVLEYAPMQPCPLETYDPFRRGQFGLEGNPSDPHNYYCVNHFEDLIWSVAVHQYCAPTKGNPCNVGTGDKSQTETDYSSPTLRFARTYHSLDQATGRRTFGNHWLHSYSRFLLLNYGSPASPSSAVDSAGHFLKLEPDGTDQWKAVSGSPLSVRRVGNEFVVRNQGGTVERYDASGRLIRIEEPGSTLTTLGYDGDGRLETITDFSGRRLTLAYEPEQDRVRSLTDPDGKLTAYRYDDLGNLEYVDYPDQKTRRYHYEKPELPTHLTGITDENGERFATYDYDSSARVKLSEHAGGADRVQLSYSEAGTTVTDSLGHQTTYVSERVKGVPRIKSQSQQGCASCSNEAALTGYDANGFVTSRTDFNGNLTTTTPDAYGRETSRTVGAGTADARTVTTTWHPSLWLPESVTDGDQKTEYGYNSLGNRSSEKITDLSTGAVRLSTRTYCETMDAAAGCPFLGLLRSEDGPRTDVADITSYGYDSFGNLVRITNALGHVTQIPDHDLHGNPLRIIDPNNVTTTLSFDARQRLRTRAVDGKTTLYEHDGVGQLKKVTLPDQSWTAYDYDAAHRLIAIRDIFGNRIQYTLDDAGNREKEEVFDPSGVLKRTQTEVFNTLSQLAEARGANGQLTRYDYDAQGNRKREEQVTPTGSFFTRTDYDALNRVWKVTDADDGVTQYSYDSLGRLKTVTDPRQLLTRYDYNAFGDLKTLTSPDTGVTTYTYDAAGNRLTQTDARNVLSLYTYDALNRLTRLEYPTSSAQNITYVYDGSNYAPPKPYGKGRLTRTNRGAEIVEQLYDARGNLIQADNTAFSQKLTTRYGYDDADRLTQITYPSGRIVNYDRDTGGRIATVRMSFGGVSTNLATGIQYLPFGPRSLYNLPNGAHYRTTIDNDYRLARVRHVDVLDQYYHFDVRDNIVRINDLLDATRSQLFGYDALSRLKSASGIYGSHAYTYDANGNRRTETRNGLADTYTYPTTSNRLESISGTRSASYSYDPGGNLTSDGTRGYVPDVAGRLFRVFQPPANLVTGQHYTAGGQRQRKTVGLETRRYLYDPSGHLLVDMKSSGEVDAEYIWLEDRPLTLIATRTGGTAKETFWFHTDHLDTPRKLTDSTKAVVWDATYEPFGKATVNVNLVNQPLRFAGQYADAETGLHQNWFRDYDFTTGRYLQSDPIGLEGGLSTYGYAEQNAIRYTDPMGLWVKRCSRKLGDRDKPATNQRFYNLLRHDYLNVSGAILSFQAGDNMLWSQGRIDSNEDQSKGCQMVCGDDKFDKYVLDAANEIGAPKYCVIAYPGTPDHMMGARNCQTWVNDVLKRAKEKYLQDEKCPTCFK